MSARHWVWISTGLLAWAVLVVLWTIGPSVCSLPEAAGASHCQSQR